MIAAKEISALELTDYFIQRIEKHDDQINAVIARDFEGALAAATAADKFLTKGGDTGPLHGVPITVKEALDVAGLATTWGLPFLKENIAARDAEVVRRLKHAGAIVLGKTNVPTALGDVQAFNEIHGVTNNPWDISRTPGGSSGGSAAAIAAGFSALEVGSDMGGSIRVPAAFCGVFGHKPTWGVVPDQGHGLPGMVAPVDLGVIGPIARHVDDLSLAMDLLPGPQQLNQPAWELQLPHPTAKPLKDFRVAIWSDDPIAPVSREISEKVENLGRFLADHGAKVSFEARPAIDFEHNFQLHQMLMWSLTGVGLSDEAYEQARQLADVIPPEDSSCLANAARARVLSHSDWLRYNNQRELLRYEWRKFYQDWDIVLCPAYSITAFAHDHRPMEQRQHLVDGEPHEYFQPMFWAGIATACYLPATAFPAGLSQSGLPIGLQAISGEYQDHLTLDFVGSLIESLGENPRMPVLAS
jgi:amidase